MKRRGFLKALAAIPVIGLVAKAILDRHPPDGVTIRFKRARDSIIVRRNGECIFIEDGQAITGGGYTYAMHNGTAYSWKEGT